MEVKIFFTNATRKAYWFRVENTTMYFSFTTLIGAEAAGRQVRLYNRWGVTTGKHINQLGIREFREVDEDELHDTISRQLASDGINAFNRYFRQGIKL